MPVDIPMGIVMALSVYVAAWLFKKSELGFGREGWKWMVTGATFFLIAATIWNISWDLVASGGVRGPFDWVNLGLNLFGWLLIAFGAIKIAMSMFSK